MSTQADLATPAVPGTAPAIELATSPDDPLTFELARALLDVAREQFTSDYARHGESIAVYRLKQQVSHWSNQFAPELRGVARTIGNRMNGQTHEFKISQKRLLHWYEHDQGNHITKVTLIKRERAWAGAGGLEIVHNDQFSPDGNGGRARSESPDKQNPGRLGKDGKRVGRRGGKQMNSDDSSTYRVDFSKVIKKRRTWDAETGKWSPWEYYAEPWDFQQIGPESKPFDGASPGGDREESGSTPPINSRLTPDSPPIYPYCSPSGSRHGSATVSSTTSQAHEETTTQPNPQREEGAGCLPPGEVDLAGLTHPENVFVTWQAKSGARAGEWVDFSLDNSPRHMPKGVRPVVLTPEEAKYLRESWPLGVKVPAAVRAERAEQRAQFLLMDPAERHALVHGTPAAAEQQDDRGPADLVSQYLIENDELDLTQGVPDELANLGMAAILDACDRIGAYIRRLRETDLYWGVRNVGLLDYQRRVFTLTDGARICIARNFPEETVWRLLKLRRKNGIWSGDEAELEQHYKLAEGEVREVLDWLVEDGQVVTDGVCYRLPEYANKD
jgi:hypothetical protein